MKNKTNNKKDLNVIMGQNVRNLRTSNDISVDNGNIKHIL